MDDGLDLAGLARAEDQFQDAVRTGDWEALASVLYEDLLVTLPDAGTLGRQEYVDAHRLGTLEVYQELDRRLLLVGTTGVSVVLVRVRGRQDDADVDGLLQCTRAWSFYYDHWRVVAAHLSQRRE